MDEPDAARPLPFYVDRALLDEHERVATDVTCVNCRYNLRTLPARGKCPECAEPVVESLSRTQLRYADAEWVKSLAYGDYALAAALTLAIAVILAEGVFPFLSSSIYHFPAGSVLARVGLFCAGALGLAGFMLLTKRESWRVGRPAGWTSRRCARCALLITVVLNPLCGLGALVNGTDWTGSVYVAMLFGSVAAVALLLLRHLRGLLCRARHLRFVLYVNGLFFVHALVFGFAVVLAVLSAAFSSFDLLAAAWITVMFPGFGLVIADAVLMFMAGRALSRAARQARALQGDGGGR